MVFFQCLILKDSLAENHPKCCDPMDGGHCFVATEKTGKNEEMIHKGILFNERSHGHVLAALAQHGSREIYSYTYIYHVYIITILYCIIIIKCFTGSKCTDKHNSKGSFGTVLTS